MPHILFKITHNQHPGYIALFGRVLNFLFIEISGRGIYSIWHELILRENQRNS